MKIRLDTINKRPEVLDEISIRHIESQRKESESVKQCFTSQSHQTMMLCIAIVGLVMPCLTNKLVDIDGVIKWYMLAGTSFLSIMLCLATIAVGCHKYNTSNRITAYQIHLSRIVDYQEANHKKCDPIATELGRIDWEEAMFTWRIVQPVLFNYFYNCLLVRRSICSLLAPKSVSREAWQKSLEYPWYDTRKIGDTMSKKACKELGGGVNCRMKKCSPYFVPGTYLRRKIDELYFFMLPFYAMLVYSTLEIYKASQQPHIAFGMVSICIAAITLYLLYNILKTYENCIILESGLLSIQSSAFVWRIVCIMHLLAKKKVYEFNVSPDIGNDTVQLYNRYTIELMRLSCSELLPNIHCIHKWLNDKENELLLFYSEQGPYA